MFFKEYTDYKVKYRLKYGEHLLSSFLVILDQLVKSIQICTNLYIIGVNYYVLSRGEEFSHRGTAKKVNQKPKLLSILQ